MAVLLYRLARTCFRHRWLVIAAWVVALSAVGVGAGTLHKPASDSFTIPGVQAQQASDLLARSFPEVPSDGATAQVVYRTGPGTVTVSSPTQRSAITGSVAALKKIPGVISVTDPFQAGAISQDGKVALATVSFAQSSQAITDDQRTQLTTDAQVDSSGLTTVVGGSAAKVDSANSSSEVVAFLVGAVVLAITFGSMVAAGLPLLTAVFGVGTGLAGLYLMSHFVELSSTAPVLALMLGLAVGIDYALFLINRYRSELIAGDEPDEAIGRAAGTAGSAVVFAGLTVIIALAGLAVVGIPFLTVMGLAAAGTVAVAVSIALTLLPALLALAPRKVIGARIPFVRRPDFDESTVRTVARGERWAKVVVRHRVGMLVAALAVLTVLAIPFLSLRTNLPNDSTAPKNSASRVAFDTIADEFGPGLNAPLSVVINGTPSDVAIKSGAVVSSLRAEPDVASVDPPVLNKAKDTAIVSLTPRSGPNDQDTVDLVHRIRTDVAPGIERGNSTRLYVAGATALQIDVSQKLNSALPIYLVVVVGLALILLTIVFRSIVVPVKAALGFLLTSGATLGALVAIFQWGWLADLIGVPAAAPIVSFIPILVIAILFGLAMDYEVFLVSRMREEFAQHGDARAAVVGGFRHGARVVTAAALIMVAVFAGFVLRDDTTVKALGFALAFGVLIDAFVVRMTIVPAVMAMVGRRGWWLPRWLDRLLPNVDVEGHGLEAQRAVESPAVAGRHEVRASVAALSRH